MRNARVMALIAALLAPAASGCGDECKAPFEIPCFAGDFELTTVGSASVPTNVGTSPIRAYTSGHLTLRRDLSYFWTFTGGSCVPPSGGTCTPTQVTTTQSGGWTIIDGDEVHLQASPPPGVEHATVLDIVDKNRLHATGALATVLTYERR
jgi:hypothetical protein